MSRSGAFGLARRTGVRRESAFLPLRVMDPRSGGGVSGRNTRHDSRVPAGLGPFLCNLQLSTCTLQLLNSSWEFPGEPQHNEESLQLQTAGSPLRRQAFLAGRLSRSCRPRPPDTGRVSRLA